MGDGFSADPEQLRSYAQQVDDMAGAVGEGRDAADTIMTTNAFSGAQAPGRDFIDKQLGMPDTGRLDMAYGLICQPYGMVLEDMQQQLTDTIGHVIDMMAMLSAGLRQCAEQYTEDDDRNRNTLREAGKNVERALIPTPNADTSITAPRNDVGRLPQLPKIPEVPTNG